MAGEGSMTVRVAASKLLVEEHADVLGEAVRVMLGEVMEAEVCAAAGAEWYQRSPDREAQRNGYRPREWDTRVGTIELAIPRLRSGSYFPSFLEPRRRSEQALVAVVQEAYINGVSTRKVERLVEQLGIAGMSRSTVSRLCQSLDEQVKIFRERPLEGRYPYLWLDAKMERVREPGGVRQKALVIAYAVHETGRREVIGIDLGEAETEAFWRDFLRSLRARGLAGVRLCVSDAHQGLKHAIGQVLGVPWQRCTVHFLRDMLGHVQKSQQQMVGAAIRQVFAASTRQEAAAILGDVCDRLQAPAAKVATLLEQAEDDLLAFLDFPVEHRSKLRSTNPLERVNREIARRSDVVGIYPNDASLIRLAGCLLIEQCDEWLVTKRYLSQESIALLYPDERTALADAGQPALQRSAGHRRQKQRPMITT
jgi:putative transposase